MTIGIAFHPLAGGNVNDVFHLMPCDIVSIASMHVTHNLSIIKSLSLVRLQQAICDAHNSAWFLQTQHNATDAEQGAGSWIHVLPI